MLGASSLSGMWQARLVSAIVVRPRRWADGMNMIDGDVWIMLLNGP